MRRKGFVILDRDGTLIKKVDYLSRPEQVELLPGVVDGLRRLRAAGLGLVVVTNQSGVARGYFSTEAVWDVHQRLRELLAYEGIYLDGIYHCPHQPSDGCACRKPGVTMVEDAARDLRFDPATAFVIGDNLCDVQLGQNIGAMTFLVRTGHGAEIEANPEATPDLVIDDLAGAADWILTMTNVTVAEKTPISIF